MSNVDVIHRYFAAVNAEDWDALRDLWHPSVTWRATAARPRAGVDEVMTYYPKVMTLYPTHHDEPVRIIDAGETVTVEIAFTGRNSEGKPVQFDAIDVFDFTEGRISKFSSWFDIDEIRAQL